MLEGNNMGSCELCVIMFVQNHSLRCISNYVHSRSIYCAGVGNSSYVLHPVSQIVPDVALVIVIRCSIDIRNLNVDSWLLPLHTPLFLQVNTCAGSFTCPSPRLKSHETQATDTVCFTARLSVCSVSSAQSAMSTFSTPKESFKLEVKRYYLFLWNFPLRFLPIYLIARVVWLPRLRGV